MSVKKRKGSPFYWYDFTVHGDRFRGSTETDDLTTAKAIEAKLRTDALLSPHFGKKKDKLTMDAAMGRYWIEYAQYLKSGLSTIQTQCKCLIKYFGKDTTLDQIDDASISVFKSKRRGKVSDTSINRELALLRRVLNVAKEHWGVSTSETSFRKHMLREPQARTRWITPDEADNLIECAADHLKPIIRFALLTGVRKSNITNLKWKDIKLTQKQISFQIKSNIPGGRNLVLPISDQLMILLNNQKGFKEPSPESFVFTYRGEPILKPNKAFRSACKKAKIKDFRFHDLRHTAASWMVQAGIPIDLVQDILGHTQITTTRKYTHRTHSEKVKALQMVGMSQMRHNIENA